MENYEDNNSFRVCGKKVVIDGQKITIDGSTGKVYADEVPTVEPEISSEFKEILQWSSEMKGIKIRANADTVESATLASKYRSEEHTSELQSPDHLVCR